MGKNERVRLIRNHFGLTMEDFGKRLLVTKVSISNIESGKRQLTDRMCKSICDEFGVNEEWILTGEGNMFITLSRKEQIAAFFADVLKDPEDSFRVQFIDALSRMTVEDWDYIGDMMKRITKKEES